MSSVRLTERAFAELSDLPYRFFSAPLPGFSDGEEALVVAFEGRYGENSAGNGDALFMKVIAGAGLQAWWHYKALVYDLRAMSYRSGDAIGAPLAGHLTRFVPHAIVCSDLNCDGLDSLIRLDWFGNPEAWLFDTLEGALEAVAEQVRNPPSQADLAAGVRQFEKLFESGASGVESHHPETGVE
jgi:hypothetical protein